MGRFSPLMREEGEKRKRVKLKQEEEKEERESLKESKKVSILSRMKSCDVS